MPDDVINDFCLKLQNAGVDLVLHLPCDRVAPLLYEIIERLPDIPLTREEEGVGIAAGAVLAGKKPIIIVQSSGFGNMVNAIMSLTKYYKLPLPIFISQRGVYKENVAAQIPMGSRLPMILDAMEVEYDAIDSPSDLDNIDSELKKIFQENRLKCFLLSPKLCEGLQKPKEYRLQTDFSKAIYDKVAKEFEYKEVGSDLENLKTRYDALSELQEFLVNKAIICNMGFPSRELYSVFDQKSNFYMLGSLGLASSIGLGVALFTEKEIVVIDGDGSLLMNPNALISIGAVQPKNLTIVCLDNGTYGSTGNQPTWSSFGLNLENLARAVGITQTYVTTDPKKISTFTGPGPKFVRLLIKPGNEKVGTIDLSASEIKNRFSQWLRE